jgi:holo-[acyl-carrier protein] synthase
MERGGDKSLMVGVDVVDIERLRRTLQRSPELGTQLFTPAERRYCARYKDPIIHLAGTLAAKEAVVKAMGSGGLRGGLGQIEIEHDDSGAPRALVESDGSSPVELSISHDGPVAVAVAFVR